MVISGLTISLFITLWLWSIREHFRSSTVNGLLTTNHVKYYLRYFGASVFISLICSQLCPVLPSSAQLCPTLFSIWLLCLRSDSVVVIQSIRELTNAWTVSCKHTTISQKCPEMFVVLKAPTRTVLSTSAPAGYRSDSSLCNRPAGADPGYQNNHRRVLLAPDHPPVKFGSLPPILLWSPCRPRLSGLATAVFNLAIHWCETRHVGFHSLPDSLTQ